MLLHGGGGFDRRIAEYNRYASALASQGIDAYLVYYYSDATTSAACRSAADIFTERYPAWAKLVDDLADHLLTQPDSNGKVGLVGFSNGGILATGASTLDPKINAAVIYYGTEPWPLEERAKRFPPLLRAARRRGPGDPRASRATSSPLWLRIVGAKADLVIYPGEGHGFGPTCRQATAPMRSSARSPS